MAGLHAMVLIFYNIPSKQLAAFRTLGQADGHEDPTEVPVSGGATKDISCTENEGDMLTGVIANVLR